MPEAMWRVYLGAVADVLRLSMPGGATPFQVLDAAMGGQMKTAPDDVQERIGLALAWVAMHPEFKPTKRQRLSFEVDWGVGWPVAPLANP
jgi:hypothetical protein